MKLIKKQRVILILLNEFFRKMRRKRQAKQRNKNAWVKPWLKNRADSSACNNLFAELWLCDVVFPRGAPFRNVTMIQLSTFNLQHQTSVDECIRM